MATTNATHCLRHLSDIIEGYADISPESPPKRKLYLHNRDSSGETLAQALTLKETATFMRNNLGVLCFEPPQEDHGAPGPCTLYIREEMRALLEETGGDMTLFQHNPSGRTDHIQGTLFYHKRAFAKPSACLAYLNAYFEMLPGTTNIPGLDLRHLDHYRAPENRNTAFGQALLDASWNPQTTFTLKTTGARPLTIFPAKEYFKLRKDEKGLLDEAIASLPHGGSVLDLGCGIGRHLKYIRARRPDAQLFGVDTCPGLLQHCRQEITPPAHFACIDLGPTPPDPTASIACSRLGALRQHRPANPRQQVTAQFDLILLLGDGLGIFGDQARIKEALTRLIGLLNPGGAIRLETGNWLGGHFALQEQEIEYNWLIDKKGHTRGKRDTGIQWGAATEAWLRQACAEIGIACDIPDTPRHMRIYFFATLRPQTADPRARAVTV